MATFTVTNTADSGAGSLRQAVRAANAAAGADTIVFDAALNGGTDDIIRLTSGQVRIRDELTIDGGDGVTITGDAAGDDVTDAAGITEVQASGASLLDNSRIFDASGALTLDGLTLTGGHTIAAHEVGGAVRVTGKLTLSNSTVSGNSTAGDYAGGGGIAGSEIAMTNSTVSGNSTAGGRGAAGGGIYGSDVTVADSTVRGNRTTGYYAGRGGGIAGLDVTVTNSTVSGNRTYSGGGGIAGYDVIVTNSTFSGNWSGGIYGFFNSSITLINSTVTGNRAGGIFIEGPPSPYYADRSELNLANSIVLGNSKAGRYEISAGGAFVLSGGTIVGDEVFSGMSRIGSATAKQVFETTMVIAGGMLAGKLADNGGPTQTIALNPDVSNPALGGGLPVGAPSKDQRGEPRDAAPDLGAFEAEPVAGLVLRGTAAAEVLTGSALDDQIYGGGGDDTLLGLTGGDQLRGGFRDDLLAGGSGHDGLEGGPGGDRLAGGFGNDWLAAGDGADRLGGDRGDDRLSGGASDDKLRGGLGDDRLVGGHGGDGLTGGAGDDRMSGGKGLDTFVFAPGFGEDTIIGFDASPWGGQDLIDLRAFGISPADFEDRVTITDLGDDTQITVIDGGTILFRGVSGNGANRIDVTDFGDQPGATFTVTNSADSGAGSLRQAVRDANAAAGADRIVFGAAFDGGAEDTIRLTSGQIKVTGKLTIDGDEGVTITGDAAGDDVTDPAGITDVAASGPSLLDDNSRIFAARGALTLDGLTLTGGHTTADDENGGAVRINGKLTLSNSTVSGNSTAGDRAYGGGIAGSDIAVTNSTVSGNSTAGEGALGGGIRGSTVALTSSSVTGNSAAGYRAGGGGIAGGDVTVTNSSVSDNSAVDYGNGGGIYSSNVSITNSTISGNSAGLGGGIYNYDGSVIVTNSTISGNSAAATSGGGIRSSGDYFGAPPVELRNSIVLGNTASNPWRAGLNEVGADGGLVLTGGNILGHRVFTGMSEIGSTSAKQVFETRVVLAGGVLAGQLGDNGGPTQTIALNPDVSNPALGGTSLRVLENDQRGEPRDAAPDLGAFEAEAVAGTVLRGAASNDELTGTALADQIYGQGGDDTLLGLTGGDQLRGGFGNDQLSGSSGRDGLEGGQGHDMLKGALGNDWLGDGPGDDHLAGGLGDDTLSGGRGQDTLKGDLGDDRQFGGIGADRLTGGAGDDRLSGGKGADTFVFDADFGQDTITGFDGRPTGGQDLIDLRAFGISPADFEDNVVITDLGDDTQITVVDGGTILCRGVFGSGANRIDATDFLL